MGAKLPETPEQWLDRYHKRYLKAYRNYQETGMQKYDTQAYEYEVICSAFRAQIEKRAEDNDWHMKRVRNCKAVIDRLVNESYTKAEVVELLRQAVYW